MSSRKNQLRSKSATLDRHELFGTWNFMSQQVFYREIPSAECRCARCALYGAGVFENFAILPISPLLQRLKKIPNGVCSNLPLFWLKIILVKRKTMSFPQKAEKA